MAIFEHSNHNQAEKELIQLEDKEIKQKQKAEKRFDELHKAGAERFGGRWLTCNLVMAKLRDLPYLPYPDKRIDALLSEAAWKMAEHRPALTADERATVENLRNASDQYDPFTGDEVAALIAIIDRLTK